MPHLSYINLAARSEAPDFARYEFRTNRRRQWRLRREPGLSEIASKGPGPRYGAAWDGY